jgi:hypothetical protein
MTATRAAAYLGATFLCAAWLASAAGVVMSPAPQPEQTSPVKTSGTESLAAEVQAQTVRLRERMATPPTPREPLRNPFAFASREEPKGRTALPPVAQPAPLTPGVVPEPPLSLIGVAEQLTPQGTERTAIVTADSDEIYMIKEGDLLGGRYRVKAVGPGSLELTDLVTGAVRRLALR